VKKAFEGELRSRAVFKLEEINEKYKLIQQGDLIIDLGASPGSWSLYASNLVDPEHGGAIVAVDLLEIDPIPNTQILQGDITSRVVQDKITAMCNGREADIVMSDMMANTTGHKGRDHYLSVGLCETALDFAVQHLRIGGTFLCKMFQGSEEKAFVDEVKGYFTEVKVYKPKSSRSESRETFVIARKRL
jgi:23S rRNA (uridine2552-2'-O)-methyltransferase